jgi:hypothetical protein
MGKSIGTGTHGFHRPTNPQVLRAWDSSTYSQSRTPGKYRGIAILEVVYKLVAKIIERRLSSKIKFHDAVHGYRPGRGTGTAIIETKLLMQLAQRTTKPRYFVFIDLKKAYDTLDRGRTIAILKGYGVGDNLLHIIQTV